jgi:hypothetical protein
MQIVKSVAGVPIRLIPERTEHIERRHPEMTAENDRILETLSTPDYVQDGDSGTLIAVSPTSTIAPRRRNFHPAVYRHVSSK